MFEIFCDFDNTITTVDCTDSILEKFASSEWLVFEDRLINNKITAKECLQKQIPLIKANQKELEKFILEQVEVRKGFTSFVEFCNKLNYSLAIVSDGLDFVIKLILQKYNINNIPIYSNQLQINQNGFNILFPLYKKKCKVGLGNCKCSIVKKNKKNIKRVYIGDGSSDYCTVQNEANYVIARGKLVDFCRQNNINYLPFNNFLDVIQILKSIEEEVNFEK